MAPAAANDVLRALDVAKTQTYHFKAIIIAGMGFFTDAYDLFVISVLTKLLGRIYYYDAAFSGPGTLPANVNVAVLGTALCGTLAGQLFFGWAGDKYGRKKVYGITLMLMVITSLGQGLSLGNTPDSVITTLCFFRFWLGFGIGGDYPLSATIMSEYSNTKTRGGFVAAVFAMQGVGILSGSAFAIMISAIFRSAYPRDSFAKIGQASTPKQADFVWRIILMFGAVPAALTFYSRSKMPETARYTALIEKDQAQAARDMGRVLDTTFETDANAPVKVTGRRPKSTEFGLLSRKFARRHGMHLVGTCTTWFVLDVAFYSQNLFQNVIFDAVGWVPHQGEMSALEEVFRNSRAQAIIALVSTVPGYWFTVFTVDILGRKFIQIMGFTFMSIFMYILSIDFYALRGNPKPKPYSGFNGGNHTAFVVMYAFTFFFANFGPNATTFIVPAECFPARLRSTCHGISSAAGKAGAIVGTIGFLYASQPKKNPARGYPPGIGIKHSLLILAITNTTGIFFSFLIPETKGRSLEDLSGEDDNAIEDQQSPENGNFHKAKDGSEV